MPRRGARPLDRRSAWWPSSQSVAALVALVALPACGATGGPSLTPAPVSVVPIGASGARGLSLETTQRVDGHEVELAGTPERVFAALEEAFAALQIPLTMRDAPRRTLGNEGFKFRRQLGTLPSRRLFDCGGSSGMPNAETYTITASVVAAVTAVADSTTSGRSTVLTVVQASAENPSYPGSGVACSSTGVLETQLTAEVRARLAPGSER